MQITTAMILAAGQATRLRPLTDDQPKPMLPVAGKPLVEHTLNQLVKLGIKEAAINLHHCPQVVKNYFGTGSKWNVHLEYSLEPELMGTAGGVKKLENFFSGAPFLLVYGDNLTTCKFDRLIAHHQTCGGLVTIALFWRDDVSRRSAVKIQPDTQITRFVEKPNPAEAPSQWISAGMMVLEPEIFNYILPHTPADFGFDVLPKLLANGEKIYGYYMQKDEGLWWIDTLEDYRRTCKRWANGFPV